MARRPRIKGSRKSKTLNVRSVTQCELDMLRVLSQLPAHWRPKARYQCEGAGGKVCPYVSCKYHLYLDVDPRTGSIKINFPDLEVWELENCCVLDVAEEGGVTLEEVGANMNLTRERARQIELKVLRQLRHADELRKFKSSPPEADE